MDIISVALFCIASCMILKTLSGISIEIKVVCSVLAACLVTLKFLEGWSDISAALSSLFEQTQMDEEYLKIIFKSLGICYVTQLACDCCKDCGENAIASQLELVGKAALLVVALPLFSAAAEVIRSLLLF